MDPWLDLSPASLVYLESSRPEDSVSNEKDYLRTDLRTDLRKGSHPSVNVHTLHPNMNACAHNAYGDNTHL